LFEDRKETFSELRTVAMGNANSFSLVLDSLRDLSTRGGWLVMQNCHFVDEWPEEVLRNIQVMNFVLCTLNFVHNSVEPACFNNTL